MTRLGTVMMAAALLIPAAATQATILYSNDFDTENSGVSASGYTGFAGLTVPYPSVDLVHTGDGSGVTCAGGRGGCVDLDGGTSGQLLSSTYSFSAGERVTLSFSASGSQRADSPSDVTYYGFEFDQQTAGSFDFSSTYGLHVADMFDDFGLGLAIGAPFDLGFHDVTLSFVASNGGTFRFLFDDYTPGAGDSDDDDAGRVIDNIALDVSAVPEPASWVMMIAGFGLVGAAMRRRLPRPAMLPA